MAQWYAQVGGQRFGPVGDEEIRNWYAQGRIKPTDYVWCEGMANWVPASTQWGAPAGAFGSQPAAYAGAAPAYGRHLKPDRGSTILVLGILGLVVCGICGIIAWVMGNNDLREMAAGTMDRAGEGNTKAGRICGMIATIMMIVGTIIGIIYIIGVIAFVSSAASHSPRYYGG